LTLKAENALHINIFLFLVGVVYWTFGEYTLHRFLFHGEEYWVIYAPKNKLVLTFHFLIHGIHHAFPMDRYRLVFPPAPGFIVLYLFFGVPLENIFTYHTYAPLAMGIIFGYVSYDMMHYYLHHADIKSGFMKEMKSYHMLHHYRDGEVGFGITNKLWDKLFGTELLRSNK
jgi:4-hydroxysphinganine ceramide fatty acyl 2-hydroxylase